MSLQVYDHQYKAVLDGVETDSVMEIDPGRRIEIFRMGNGSNEVLEVHDFKNVSEELRQGLEPGSPSDLQPCLVAQHDIRSLLESFYFGNNIFLVVL